MINDRCRLMLAVNLVFKYPFRAHPQSVGSGKTYQALQALKEADSGAYCGPLRLLAWEVRHRQNTLLKGSTSHATCT